MHEPPVRLGLPLVVVALLLLLLQAGLAAAAGDNITMVLNETYTTAWTSEIQPNFTFVPKCAAPQTTTIFVLQLFVDGDDLLQVTVNGRPAFGNCTSCVTYSTSCYPITWQVAGRPTTANRRTVTARIVQLATQRVNVSLPFAETRQLSGYADQFVFSVPVRPVPTDGGGQWPYGRLEIVGRDGPGDVGLTFGLSILDPTQYDQYTTDYRAVTGPTLTAVELMGDTTACQFFLVRAQALPTNGSWQPVVRFTVTAALWPYPAAVPLPLGQSPPASTGPLGTYYANAGVRYGYIRAPVALVPLQMWRAAATVDPLTTDPRAVVRFNLTATQRNDSMVVLTRTVPRWTLDEGGVCRDGSNRPLPGCLAPTTLLADVACQKDADGVSASPSVEVWGMDAGPVEVYPQTGLPLPPVWYPNAGLGVTAELVVPPVRPVAWGARLAITNLTWYNATPALGSGGRLASLELPQRNDTNAVYLFTISLYAQGTTYLYAKAGHMTTGQCADIVIMTSAGASAGTSRREPLSDTPPPPQQQRIATGGAPSQQQACYGPYQNVKTYAWCCQGPPVASNNRLFVTVTSPYPKTADRDSLQFDYSSFPLLRPAQPVGQAIQWSQTVNNASGKATCPTLENYYLVRPQAPSYGNGTRLAVTATVVSTTEWRTKQYTLAASAEVFPSFYPASCKTNVYNATNLRPDGYWKPSDWSTPLRVTGGLVADTATADGFVVHLKVYCENSPGPLDKFEGTLQLDVTSVAE